ncbi:MAG TPA: hypothetical protein VF648_00555 [Pyrinomonadaceae bacterium]|jgi:hypothetical protein
MSKIKKSNNSKLTIVKEAQELTPREKEFLKTLDIIQSGYASVLPGSGMLVDRREHLEATPVQKNEMLGVPEPKSIGSNIAN